MGKYAYHIIIVLLIIGALLWLGSKDSYQFFIDSPLRAISQIAAILGAIGFMLSFVLSSRLPIIEKAALPLDKSYKIHRLIGTLAGAGILLHVSTQIANLLPSPMGLSLYLIPGTNLSYTLGIIAFYLLLLMLASTIYMKLPYNIWRWIHKVTGATVVFAGLHIFLISSDVATNLPLRIYMLALVAIAVISWLYRLIIYPLVSFRSEYVVANIIRAPEIEKIVLQVVKNPLRAKPGQFALFSFRAKSSAISQEAHPFSILESTEDTITIAVKQLGDFTYKLQQLEIGDRVKIDGPYGGFGEAFRNSSKNAIWIAGGIGITPFINLLQFANKTQLTNKHVIFYYSTKDEDQIFHPHIMQETSTLPIEYHYSASTKQGRLSPEKIVGTLSQPPQDYEYFLCGPKGMLVTITEYLRKIGISSSQIHVEDFDFKDLDI